jgi:hypothetical protein
LVGRLHVGRYEGRSHDSGTVANSHHFLIAHATHGSVKRVGWGGLTGPFRSVIP